MKLRNGRAVQLLRLIQLSLIGQNIAENAAHDGKSRTIAAGEVSAYDQPLANQRFCGVRVTFGSRDKRRIA